ncbi:MAG: histidinol-phosphatase [Clostridia bacterium]|nr:histidinol-phosphatase [Clostridia bacterium]
MFACYHTHTARCHHAEGTDEEYVKVAIAEGVRVLGFSDHAPMPYPNGYESYYKMRLDELGEYCESVLSLREKYAGQIEIRLGLETEYYPELFEASLDVWRRYPIEYLILGQHWVDGETCELPDPSSFGGKDGTRVTKYVDRVIEAMRTGRITYVAHPDLINYTGDDEKFFRGEMGRLICESMRLGMPLEYNLLGQSGRRSYPNPVFWEEAGKLGATAILGCDAHTPDRVAKRCEIAEAEEFLRRCGVRITDRVELINPFK